MYRAYHAIRGLTGPTASPPTPSTASSRCCGSCWRITSRSTSSRRSTCAAETFRSRLSADYKANRTPMPGDLAEQVPWVHEACEAMGVPILTSEGFEADDVIGTLASKAAAHGMQAAIVTGDKDFFQLGRDGIRVYNPRDEGHVVRRGRRAARSSACAPAQVVRRAGADGRLDRQRQGRARHRREGRARSDRDVRLAGRRCWQHAAEIKQKKYREGLLTYADQARQSRELVTIRHRRGRAVRGRAVPLQGRRSRALLRAVLEDGVPHAGRRVRADGVVGA